MFETSILINANETPLDFNVFILISLGFEQSKEYEEVDWVETPLDSEVRSSAWTFGPEDGWIKDSLQKDSKRIKNSIERLNWNSPLRL